jgi:uncharacterized protein (DUF4415 family)
MKTVTPFTHDDGEVRELGEADVLHFRPAREILPSLVPANVATELLRPRGRPRAAVTKVAISLRLPPEVLARWKATGPGWQTRMADALARAIT